MGAGARHVVVLIFIVLASGCAGPSFDEQGLDAAGENTGRGASAGDETPAVYVASYELLSDKPTNQIAWIQLEPVGDKARCAFALQNGGKFADHYVGHLSVYADAADNWFLGQSYTDGLLIASTAGTRVDLPPADRSGTGGGGVGGSQDFSGRFMVTGAVVRGSDWTTPSGRSGPAFGLRVSCEDPVRVLSEAVGQDVSIFTSYETRTGAAIDSGFGFRGGAAAAGSAEVTTKASMGQAHVWAHQTLAVGKVTGPGISEEFVTRTELKHLHRLGGTGAYRVDVHAAVRGPLGSVVAVVGGLEPSPGAFAVSDTPA